MSEPISPRLKISREGIVLIKSFEGFRPRAVRREDGAWVIGYGHTLSAREGASVSEGDAELLLRYDLLPIEKAVNETAAPLNQHQFDALVSFAHSVGLDRFGGSDVVASVAAGATGAAADALMGWPERERPETALRRRAAERALFIADPTTAVTLSDLLAAPLPPPHIPPPDIEPDAPSAPPNPPSAEPEEVPPTDARRAAVAALLGDPDGGGDRTETPPIIPDWNSQILAPATTGPAEPIAEPEPEPETDTAVPTAIDAEREIEAPAPSRPSLDGEASVSEDRAVASAVDQLALKRYSPYGAPIVGSLPYLAPAAPREPARIDPVGEEATPAPDGSPVSTGPVVPPEPDAEAPAAREDPTVPAPVSELVLTPPEEAPEPAVIRPLWEASDRATGPFPEESTLFGEDPGLTQATGAVSPSEHEPDAPARFDWSETGAFVIMGGVGLTAFGAAMAAFRLAAEQSGGDEVTLIAWVLAVIGAACVGVSSFNLYRRFGLPGGD